MGKGYMQVLKGRDLLRNLHVHERIILKLQIKGKRVLIESTAQDMKPGVGLELKHPSCVCNIKVQCKEVKNTTSLLSVDSVVNKTTCSSLLPQMLQ